MKLQFLGLFIFITTFVSAQSGGNSSFSFLNRSFNATGLSFGGDFISLRNNQIQNSISNPALLNNGSQNQFSFNHMIQTGGVQSGLLSLGRYNSTLKSNQSIAIRYVDYGKMNETDETGEVIGTFLPGDFILSSGFAKPMNSHLTFGGQLNFIYSQYNNVKYFGSSLDFGGFYTFKDTTKTLSFVLKNMGFQLKNKTSSNSPLPFQLDVAFSHKLEHAPVRFSYLFHHLNQFDLSYFDPNIKGSIDPLTGDSILPQKTNLLKKTMMHFTPQIQLTISKNIHLNFAFDYYKRYQLALSSKPRLSGFSTGIELNFKKFMLTYAYSNYSAAGSINAITLLTNINSWKKHTSF
jgi:hypothetical protein